MSCPYQYLLCKCRPENQTHASLTPISQLYSFPLKLSYCIHPSSYKYKPLPSCLHYSVCIWIWKNKQLQLHKDYHFTTALSIVFEQAGGPSCYSFSCPKAILSIWWGLQLLGLSRESHTPCTSPKTQGGFFFQVVVHTMTWLNLWWPSDLVILVWWLSIM